MSRTQCPFLYIHNPGAGDIPYASIEAWVTPQLACEDVQRRCRAWWTQRAEGGGNVGSRVRRAWLRAEPSEVTYCRSGRPGAPSRHGQDRLATPARPVARYEQEDATSMGSTAGVFAS